MGKVCVLFGAGADAPYSIGTGINFAESVLGIGEDKNTKTINKTIKDHYNNLVKSGDDWYPKYYQLSFSDDDLLKASLRKANLDTGEKVSDKKFKTDFERLKSTRVEAQRIINANPSYMGLIDSKFPTLIAPTILGRGKFWQIVSCYCRAYLVIVQQILGRTDYKSFLNPTAVLLREIHEVSKSKNAKETYYSILNKTKSPKIDISVVTTNYTYFCEEISGLNNDRIAYVHGRIGLFESPKNLCVYDVEHDDIKGEIVFPYLFIQSGVKPIVERRQIEEYSKMIKFMDESEKIIILGYNLNYDDNHINSIIRSEAINGKEIVYLAFDDGNRIPMNREDVLKRLKLPDETANLRWRKITSTNANQIFEEELK